MGWYGAGEGPGVFRSVLPAWGDANLRHLARDIESPLFLSYVRATSGPPIQETNCHPFSHGRWLFVHNGAIADFRTLRRDLMLAVAPELIADIQGSTDSEVLFHLALSHGSRRTARSARMRDRCRGGDRRAHAVEFPFQGSVGVSDGETLWALRYPSEGRSRSLFASADVEALHKLHPDNRGFRSCTRGDRLIVSEPLADLQGAGHEIPNAPAVTVRRAARSSSTPSHPASPATV